jgi:hypothetical protein
MSLFIRPTEGFFATFVILPANGYPPTLAYLVCLGWEVVDALALARTGLAFAANFEAESGLGSLLAAFRCESTVGLIIDSNLNIFLA